MKVAFFAVLGLACLAATLGLPASPVRTIDDEIEFVPLERQNPYGDQPIVDTGVIGYDGPFSNPFSGLLENLEGVMTRIRKQMETLLKRFPVTRGNSSEELPPDFSIGGGLPSFGFGDIDLSKGNTTSVTKVIDGHKVVINETEYKNEDDFGGTFFKVRIIDVKPDITEQTTNKDAEEVTTVPTVRDRESVENEVENEISKHDEAANFDDIETFDEVDNVRLPQKFSVPLRDTEWNEVTPLETFEDNSLNSVAPVLPVDLSGDIRVNQILADQGAPMNPDAELIYDVRVPRARQFETFIDPR